MSDGGWKSTKVTNLLRRRPPGCLLLALLRPVGVVSKMNRSSSTHQGGKICSTHRRQLSASRLPTRCDKRQHRVEGDNCQPIAPPSLRVVVPAERMLTVCLPHRRRCLPLLLRLRRCHRSSGGWLARGREHGPGTLPFPPSSSRWSRSAACVCPWLWWWWLETEESRMIA